MTDNEVTTIVKAPVKQVFEFVSDIPNYANWVPPNSPFFIESKVTSEGPVGLGTTYEDKLTLGKAVGKVVEYRPFERLVFEQKWYPESHVFAARIEYHFEPLNGDTKISRVNNITPVEWAAPLKPGLTEMSREESRCTCEALKKTLERESSSTFKEGIIKTVDNEVTTVIQAPVKQVFNFVSDIPNYANWVTLNSPFFIESKVTSEGPVGLGTAFEDKLTLGKSVGKVVECQPFERLVFEQKWYPESHAFEGRIEYHFEPANGDTKISRVYDITPVEWAEPLKPALTEMSKEESQRTCEAIRKTFER
jgi:uncharacterized protein YndB with AHSA1/START domain